MKKILVIGGLNIDFLGIGVDKICSKGELSYGGKFEIKPGGKSRNIAQMIANQNNKGEVVMIGKTAKDEYGLYKIPIDSLKKSGVDTNNIIIDKTEEETPGVALIPVDKNGNNQIYVLPGVNDNFLKEDLLEKSNVFAEIGNNNGIVVFSFELPLETAITCIKLANKYSLKVFVDPGGIIEGENYLRLLKQDIFFIKPNEHETKILTGVEVIDFESAKKAAQILLNYGIKNILITLGKNGAYFFSKNTRKHYKIPEVNVNKNIKDETGCGDQTIATLCSNIVNGETIDNSIKKAILSGTLQYYKAGVEPLTKEEIK